MKLDTLTQEQIPRVRQIPGDPGSWVILLGDLAIFGAFFASFLVERSKAPDVFRAGRHSLHAGVGLANTLILVLSSLCVVLAINAIRASAHRPARSALQVAIACAVAFVGLKLYEYHSLISAGRDIGANHFYLYYFALTGLHLLHVVAGTVVLILLLLQTRRIEIGETRLAVIQSGGNFWHLVDILWLVLFPLLYLVS